MSAEDQPVARELHFPCGQYCEALNDGCLGSITKFGGRWCCDTCDYDYGGDSLPEPDYSET